MFVGHKLFSDLYRLPRKYCSIISEDILSQTLLFCKILSISLSSDFIFLPKVHYIFFFLQTNTFILPISQEHSPLPLFHAECRGWDKATLNPELACGLLTKQNTQFMKICRWNARYRLRVIPKVGEISRWVTDKSSYPFQGQGAKTNTRWLCRGLFQHVDTSWTLYLGISIRLKALSLNCVPKIDFSINCCHSIYHRHPCIKWYLFSHLLNVQPQKKSCKN